MLASADLTQLASTGHPAPTVDSDLLAQLAATAIQADTDGAPDLQAVAALRASGLLAAAVPREYGGAGADTALQNRYVEQVASANASAAIILFQHYAVSMRIAEKGTAHQREQILPRLASGAWLAASAWSESGAGADKKNLSSTGRRTDDGWLLNGAKSFTTSAGLADIYLVLVQTSTPGQSAAQDTTYGAVGQTFFLITSDNPGLVPDTSLSLVGMRGSATGFVSLHDCHVTDADRLGPLGTAAETIAGVRETGATLGAVAVGIAQAAFEAALAHANRRGLLAHQAVRHRLVDMATRIEAARALVARAGYRDSDAPGTTTLHSKLFASQVAESVCATAQRMLSSAGYVTSHPLNRYGRDARAVALMGPTNDLCRELVSTPWTA